MALGDEDLPGLLEELGVPVTLGGTTTNGIKRRATDELFQDVDAPELLSRSIVAVIKTDSLPALRSGAAITVDGTAYTVRRWLEDGHGTLTRIRCVLAA